MKMDGIAAIRFYIDRIVNGDEQCRGMKVLLLDGATTHIVSCVYSQTEILQNEVYLVSRLEDVQNKSNLQQHQQPTSHLKAVCFVRPTDANMGLLVRELAKPRFAEYHLFFSAIVTSGQIRMLAEQDLFEKVKRVQELYGDFIPINEDLLSLQSRDTLAMTVAAGTSWAPKYAHLYDRNLQGLQGMLLSLKRQPSAIRYAGNSPCAEELAKDLHDTIVQDDVFHFRKSRRGGLHVLVLDRRDDPVTPLLSQWTYQAMVHELLGLNNHRVVLKGAPNIPPDLDEVVLSSTQDQFFCNNRHKNFGELGEEIQRLLQDYQKQAAQHNTGNLNSIEEMQAFMEKFPELRSRSHNVSKHVAIMGELARLVEVCSLMDISQFEQELACADDQNSHWRELMQKLQSDAVKIPDKLRLGLLFALRYELSGNIHMLQSAMNKAGVPPDMVELVNVILRYGGSKSRGPGLYGEHHNLMKKMTKSFITSVQGIQNVYAQHIPLLMDTIQMAIRGKLRADTHPFVPGSTDVGMQPEAAIPEEILVFMVGGVTYEEGTKVSEFNVANQGRFQIILGGSTVHNSTSFLEELKRTSL
jgi:vacuolar protein sorting-associated protein 45